MRHAPRSHSHDRLPGLRVCDAKATGMTADVRRRLRAEAIGTALVLAAIVGSGIMTDRLSGGNEALVLARSLTDTFAGIRPVDVPGFVAQCAGALAATMLFPWPTPALPAPTQYAVPRSETSV